MKTAIFHNNLMREMVKEFKCTHVMKTNKMVLSLNFQCSYPKYACPLHQTESHIDLPLLSVKKIITKKIRYLPTHPKNYG
jgi:hypothetical protein